MKNTITISRTWNRYNARRYSRPWAARITGFNGSATLDFIRGAYNGDDDGGELIFTAEVGEIIKYGQKDNGGGRTINQFARITENGLVDIDSATDARRLWQEWKAGK